MPQNEKILAQNGPVFQEQVIRSRIGSDDLEMLEQHDFHDV
jgi:hypothetical protein